MKTEAIFFDTARIYSDWVPGEKGRCERIIGDYLAENKNRDKWVVSTKGGHNDLNPSNCYRLNLKKLDTDVHESLRALRTDYIDLYLLHRDNTDLPVEAIIDKMNDYVSLGKIRYFGCSNWHTERIQEAQEYASQSGKQGFVANQPLWNIGSSNMAPLEDKSLVVMSKEMIQFHQKSKMAVIPYSSQAGGFFSKLDQEFDSTNHLISKSPYYTTKNLDLFSKIKKTAAKKQCPVSHVVFEYLLSQKIPTIPVFGGSSTEQLMEAIQAAKSIFSENEKN